MTKALGDRVVTQHVDHTLKKIFSSLDSALRKLRRIGGKSIKGRPRLGRGKVGGMRGQWTMWMWNVKNEGMVHSRKNKERQWKYTWHSHTPLNCKKLSSFVNVVIAPPSVYVAICTTYPLRVFFKFAWCSITHLSYSWSKVRISFSCQYPTGVGPVWKCSATNKDKCYKNIDWWMEMRDVLNNEEIFGSRVSKIDRRSIRKGTESFSNM